MRKKVIFCIFLSMLFLFSACSLPFDLHEDTEETTEERYTYVITTEHHSGISQMTDYVDWYSNSLVALHYVGARSDLKKSIKSLHSKSFSDIEESEMLDMNQVDLGGNDVFLVIPRFDQSTMTVFTVAIDSEGTVHILNQAADLRVPFLLLCNATNHPNAQIGVTLAEVSGRFRSVVRRDPDSSELQCEDFFQTMRLLEP